MAISVCLATYNGERFIKKQLTSILMQLSSDDEIIISDDSSTDNTIYIVKSFQDVRIRIFEGQKFRSPSKNFEFAINMASHPYIFLSDQDDIWVEGKVEKMKKELDDYDLVVCDRAIINETDEIILSSYFKSYPFRNKPGLIRNLFRHSFSGCCMAFKKEILNKAFPIPKDVTFHDFWIGFVCNLFYKVKFIEEPLTLYRRHDNNVSYGAQLRSGNSLYKKLQLRWTLVKYLPLIIYR